MGGIVSMVRKSQKRDLGTRIYGVDWDSGHLPTRLLEGGYENSPG